MPKLYIYMNSLYSEFAEVCSYRPQYTVLSNLLISSLFQRESKVWYEEDEGVGERGQRGESEELQIVTREPMRLTGLNTKKDELNTQAVTMLTSW